MLRQSPFWFKRQRPPALPPQLNITQAQVQTPGGAQSTDIVAIFDLDDTKAPTDPNNTALYGTWSGTPEIYGSHLGILSDNGFSKYLDGNGLQKNNWGAGAADTFYNLDGMTFSWIARPVPATDARLFQYVQADLEFIDLFFPNETTIRLTVMLGTGTAQFDDVVVADVDVDDGNFHHFVVTFNPADDRIGRLYINGSLAAETAAVTGTATFGDEAANIRRGIGFGCAYTAPDDNFSGDIDHCTILRGVFPAVVTGLDGRMRYGTSFMKYYAGQMYYNTEPAGEGDAMFGVEAAFYGADPASYSNTVYTFSSGVPHWLAY